MKFRILFVSAIVFSAIGLAFSSDLQKTESAVLSGADGKCRVPPLREALAGANAVFLGEVLREEKEGDYRNFEFKVEKYWKGAKSKNIKISVYETMRYQAWFEKGERYLVFARADEDGKLIVGRCSRSSEAVNAGNDMKSLGKGRKPR